MKVIFRCLSVPQLRPFGQHALQPWVGIAQKARAPQGRQKHWNNSMPSLWDSIYFYLLPTVETFGYGVSRLRRWFTFHV